MFRHFVIGYSILGSCLPCFDWDHDTLPSRLLLLHHSRRKSLRRTTLLLCAQFLVKDAQWFSKLIYTSLSAQWMDGALIPLFPYFFPCSRHRFVHSLIDILYEISKTSTSRYSTLSCNTSAKMAPCKKVAVSNSLQFDPDHVLRNERHQRSYFFPWHSLFCFCRLFGHASWEFQSTCRKAGKWFGSGCKFSFKTRFSPPVSLVDVVVKFYRTWLDRDCILPK